MRFFHFSSFFLLAVFSTHIAYADNKTVTISWIATGSVEDVQNYTLTYAYNSDMANSRDACETNNSYATSLICENVEITSQESTLQLERLHKTTR